jgi:hypothetical protein
LPAAATHVIDIAGRGHDHVRRDVSAAEVLVQRVGCQGVDRLRGSENGPAEGMSLPERLGEQLVDQVVGRVLDHLDLFEDHLLLALDLVGDERRTQHDIGKKVDGQRQMLVEHLDVVAGVFLGGERAMSSALRVSVPLNSMCSTKCAMPLRSSLSWREPRVSQTPIVTDRTCGMVSVMSRRPLSRTSRTTIG